MIYLHNKDGFLVGTARRVENKRTVSKAVNAAISIFLILAIVGLLYWVNKLGV